MRRRWGPSVRHRTGRQRSGGAHPPVGSLDRSRRCAGTPPAEQGADWGTGYRGSGAGAPLWPHAATLAPELFVSPTPHPRPASPRTWSCEPVMYLQGRQGARRGTAWVGTTAGADKQRHSTQQAWQQRGMQPLVRRSVQRPRHPTYLTHCAPWGGGGGGGGMSAGRSASEGRPSLNPKPLRGCTHLGGRVKAVMNPHGRAQARQVPAIGIVAAAWVQGGGLDACGRWEAIHLPTRSHRPDPHHPHPLSTPTVVAPPQRTVLLQDVEVACGWAAGNGQWAGGLRVSELLRRPREGCRHEPPRRPLLEGAVQSPAPTPGLPPMPHRSAPRWRQSRTRPSGGGPRA